MDDVRGFTAAQPSSVPEPQVTEPDTETNWSVAVKALFWFLLAPAGVLLLVKWLLQR